MAVHSPALFHTSGFALHSFFLISAVFGTAKILGTSELVQGETRTGQEAICWKSRRAQPQETVQHMGQAALERL